MKLRIVVGDSNIEKSSKKEQLKTLYLSGRLIIQGSDDVTKIALDDGRQAILAGSLVGMRTSDNEITPCTFSSANLKLLIQTSSIEKCQEVLEGRYILVIAGPGNACSVCSDRYGQSDLYYKTSCEPKIFTSDLSLIDDCYRTEHFDQVALAYGLTVPGCRPPKRRTFYQELHRLGVNEVIHIDNGQAEFSEVPFIPVETLNYGDQKLNQHADLLMDAIRVRGSRYGNVVYLSSGWDSTAILACLVHLFGPRKVRAVTGRMLYAERSGVLNPHEIKRAQQVADYYGVHIDFVDFDYRQDGPDWASRLEPQLKSHHVTGAQGINYNFLASFVASTTNGDEAIFAGEISDGAYNFGFTQYTTIFHPVLEFRQYSDKMACYLFGPTFLGFLHNGKFNKDPIYDLIRRQAGKAVFDKPAAGNPDKRTMQLLSNMFLKAKRIPLWSLRNNKILSNNGIQIYTEEMESEYLKKAAEEISPKTLYAWYLHLYNSFHWQSSNVIPLSLTAEANGLVMALPFWDSRIQEFLSAMPENWGRGLDLNPTKYPLKWMLKNRIDYPLHLQVGPHSYIYDTRPSFNLGAEIIYGSSLTPYYKDILRSSNYQDFLSAEMFDLNYIDAVVNRYIQGVETTGLELANLSSLIRLFGVV